MATENTTINTTEAQYLLEVIQNKIEMIQAIATAGTNSDNCDETTLRGLLRSIDTICIDAAEYGALKRMLEAA